MATSPLINTTPPWPPSVASQPETLANKLEETEVEVFYLGYSLLLHGGLWRPISRAHSRSQYD